MGYRLWYCYRSCRSAFDVLYKSVRGRDTFKYVLHVPYTNQEPCPNNSHWPVTQSAFWSSLGAVNTFSLYLYLCYYNKNFNSTSGLFGPAKYIWATVSPKYSS